MRGHTSPARGFEDLPFAMGGARVLAPAYRRIAGVLE